MISKLLSDLATHLTPVTSFPGTPHSLTVIPQTCQACSNLKAFAIANPFVWSGLTADSS